jgi:hypothetical protein
MDSPRHDFSQLNEECYGPGLDAIRTDERNDHYYEPEWSSGTMDKYETRRYGSRYGRRHSERDTDSLDRHHNDEEDGRYHARAIYGERAIEETPYTSSQNQIPLAANDRSTGHDMQDHYRDRHADEHWPSHETQQERFWSKCSVDMG